MNRTQRRNAANKSAKPPLARLLAYGTITLIIVVGIVAIGFRNHATYVASQGLPDAFIYVGETAPEFTADTSQGPFDLKTAKKPVLLEVFATWCPHCQHETKVLDHLYDRFGKNIDFVAVSGSNLAGDRQSDESQEDVNGFALYYGVRYPIAYDASLNVAKAYLQGGFPQIVMIGLNHRILDIDSGEVAQSKIEHWITSAMKASHLHFEVRKNGKPVDPIPWLR